MILSVGFVLELLGTVAVKETDFVPISVLPLYVLQVMVPVPLDALGI